MKMFSLGSQCHTGRAVGVDLLVAHLAFPGLHIEVNYRVFHITAHLSGSGASPMPAGSAVTVEQMADLIAFLLPPP